MLAAHMMNLDLTVLSILQHATKFHPNAKIVSIDTDQSVSYFSYSEFGQRVARLANALQKLGLNPGDRVATLAWNNHRHLELYYATACMGLVCHTINPRLHIDQIKYIANDAQDVALFFDSTFEQEALEAMHGCPAIEHVFCLSGDASAAQTSAIATYEELIHAQPDTFDWPSLDENAAMGLCYTSGTTGDPKGVVYSHRATVLHAMGVSGADWLALRSQDVAMPIVPMFHACAWGIPYAALMNGSGLVLPGPVSDGRGLHEIITREGVTMSSAVPTVWLALVEHLQQEKARIDCVDRLMMGGSAAPESLIRALEEDYGVSVMHGWGMTELSPVGTLSALKAGDEAASIGRLIEIKSRQGRPLFGVDLRIVDDEGNTLPHDGDQSGALQAKGFWTASGYFKGEKPEAFTSDGWFDTGDVATIDEEGWLRLTDRTKDVIKSGGEWISSIELENIAVGHEEILEAACIGVAHSKWAERPLVVCVRRPGSKVSKQDVLALYAGKIAKWWTPDDVVFVEELPHTATGKISKKDLRVDFADYKLPTDKAKTISA